jgi:7,8-dihydroneopterin aldolase/epimerase/oxygenase
MGRIVLEGLEFFAFHGFYDEEQKIGNKYGVDVVIEAPFERAGEQDRLSETINYEQLYRIVRHEMLQPSRLLENIAYRIIGRIFEEFASARHVEVSVSKFNPPIGGMCRRAVVSLGRDRLPEDQPKGVDLP